MFNVGDMVVYRGYGMGIAESVEKRQVGENELSFYALKTQNMFISKLPGKTKQPPAKAGGFE